MMNHQQIYQAYQSRFISNSSIMENAEDQLIVEYASGADMMVLFMLLTLYGIAYISKRPDPVLL